jgi:hypothetical protein
LLEPLGERGRLALERLHRAREVAQRGIGLLDGGLRARAHALHRHRDVPARLAEIHGALR